MRVDVRELDRLCLDVRDGGLRRISVSAAWRLLGRVGMGAQASRQVHGNRQRDRNLSRAR